MSRNSRHFLRQIRMPTQSISSNLFAVLRQFEGTTFTVAQLTDAYMTAPDSMHESKKAARQFVYRNMLRLIETGALERVSSGRHRPVYRTTEALHTTQETDSLPKEAASVNIRPTDTPSRDKLRERLNSHKVEMLTAMGEAEELDAICNEWPNMRTEVQERYNQAKDRCSKLLGRVKALEDLLASASL